MLNSGLVQLYNISTGTVILLFRLGFKGCGVEVSHGLFEG